MNRSIFLIIAIFISCISNNLFAQNIKVEGVVFNNHTGLPLKGVDVSIKGEKNVVFSDSTSIKRRTDATGKFIIEADSTQILVFSISRFDKLEIPIKGRNEIMVSMSPTIKPSPVEYETVTEQVLSKPESRSFVNTPDGIREVVIPAEYETITKKVIKAPASTRMAYTSATPIPPSGNFMPFNESYSKISENEFKTVSENPMSTFSVDVDNAAYSNVRRYINQGNLPPKNAVRIEEMINYFNYDYPQPNNEVPFSINTEIATCPWNEDNLLLHVGLQGKEIPQDNLPPSNIVFLLDVSGSMSAANKLPLLKSSLKLLLDNLRKEDRVAIVTYAGSAGLVLESTPGNQKKKIIEALNKLKSGGSTAGGQGLKLAYKVAQENLIENGNNRIVLATDGDFNVGVSSDDAMKNLIEENRDNGISISVLGYGMGNYKDSKMETIADNGNGNYAYIDNLLEAKKTLVKEFGGTFHTIAKDVKFQLKFNPKFISSYRLIGYENRLLADKDFEDDKKDAGDIGSGHNVTALYEIQLKEEVSAPEKRKYHTSDLASSTPEETDLLTLSLRYKEPKGTNSKLVEEQIEYASVAQNQVTNNFHFSAAVAEFGMLLRDSKFKSNATWESAIKMANSSVGLDVDGYRAEMIELMQHAKGFK